MLVYITEKFGSPEGSRLIDTVQAKCEHDDVIVRVHYASINPIDWKTRKGLGWGAQTIQSQLPWVLGMDYSGEIIEVGDGCVHLWSVGERVCGCQNMIRNGGTFAQTIKVHSTNISRVPDEVDLSQAAAVGLAGLTAWQALCTLQIIHGEKVLIGGGSGGVGHLTIQLAKVLGAEVYSTSSSAKQDFINVLGAIAIDYHDAEQFIHYHQYFDVIIDAVGGETGQLYLDLLKPQGRLLTLPTVTAQQVIAQANEQGKQAQGMLMHADSMQLQGLLHLLEHGKLHAHIEKIYPLECIADALEYSQTGRVTGKLLVQM